VKLNKVPGPAFRQPTFRKFTLTSPLPLKKSAKFAKPRPVKVPTVVPTAVTNPVRSYLIPTHSFRQINGHFDTVFTDI
jgi:hypothetical protein